MNQLIIRNERKEDQRIVEEITREAFWNLYVPGCDEHYLVHLLRQSSDYLPELSFVAELDGRIVGSIFFSKSYIIDKNGIRHEMVTFGPISVLPELHNQGIGRALIEYAKEAAVRQGYKAFIIYGFPGYYKRFGFRSAKDFGICSPEGKYPVAHMVLELYAGAMAGISGTAYESDLYDVDQKAAEQYDALFPPKEKYVTDSQKVFEETAGTYL